MAGGAFNWTSGTLRFSAGLSVEPGGPLGGSVTLGAGRVLEVVGGLSITNLHTVNLLGGTLAVGSMTGGANLNWTSGTLSLTASTFVADTGGILGNSPTIGPGQFLRADVGNNIHSVGESSTGMLTISGGFADFGIGALFVGNLNGSDGTLNVTNGGRVFSGRGAIAFQIGSVGEVTVSGESRWEYGNDGISIGTGGVGTLNIANGGSVVADPSPPPLFEVDSPGVIGSGGTVYVDGASSRLSTKGSLYVGGSLSVTDGGGVFVTNSTPIAGFGESLIDVGGMASVDGNGSVLNAQFLNVNGGGMVRITNDGAIRSNVEVESLGEIHGDGNITGDLQNGGLVSPGASSGTLTVDGDYTQSASGELLIELASASSYDQLLVDGNVRLAGTLTVNLIDGFVPTNGQSFTIITDNVAGTFATEMLPSVPGLIFDVIYNPQSVVLTVSPAFTADFDEDGDVDGDDLDQWEGDFGVNALSDADDDGDSDGGDFLVWQRQVGFGPSAQSSGSVPVVPAGGAVPEPASLRLYALMAIAILCCRSTSIRHSVRAPQTDGG